MPRVVTVCAFIASLFTVPLGTAAQTVQTEYAASDEIFANPERGFYSHRSVQAEGAPLSRVDLENLRDEDDVTLILRIYYLKKFRDAPLSEEQLELFPKDMAALRDAGSKAILRFAYSGNENEPDAPLATIEQHLDQLQPLFHENKDVVAAVEAGFIGAWGEWYYSSNNLNNTENRRAVTEKWLSVLPTDRMVQVRTPMYKKAIYDRTTPLRPEEAYMGTNFARTGHHNDCFLASSTDYGTYADVVRDKIYLADDTRFTTMGGETCNPNPPRSECGTALLELERFHWSYLNQDYHNTVLQNWRTGGCMDEVQRRLGYRLRLLDSVLPTEVKPGGAYAVDLRIVNEGFAAPYNPRRLEVVLRERQSGARHVVVLDEDPRFWAAGDSARISATVGVPADLPEGTYDVLLNLPAPERSIYARPEYAVRLANADVWEAETGYNSLLVATDVTAEASGDAYAGDTWFRSYESHVSAERTQPEKGWEVSPTFPNPFADRTGLTVTVPYPQPVSVRVYDVLGRQVATLHEGLMAANSSQSFTFDSTGYPGGLYLLAVRGTGFSATRSAMHIP